MKVIFCLTTARAGTKYLAYLFKNNIKKCNSKHEPLPSMFGKSIYLYKKGEFDNIKKRFNKKVKKIQNDNVDVYIETSHAFLKSFSDIAIEFYPDMKLIHLIRNPLKMAKSGLNRFKQIRKYKIPCLYKGDDGNKYMIWSLTGEEDIYKYFDLDWDDIYYLRDDKQILQFLLLQWIEIENRAMSFLKKYNKQKDCFTLHSPRDLNDEKIIREMFEFFGLETKTDKINFKGRKNKGKNPTIVKDEDKKYLQEIVDKLPSKYLQIFENKPYKNYEWSDFLYK